MPRPNENCDTAQLHEWIEKATRQAIDSTEELVRTNNTGIPLAPILTFWVNNGRSAHNKKVVRPEAMSLQLRILQGYRSVETILLWSAAETIEEMEGADLERFYLKKFLREVDALSCLIAHDM